MVVDITGLVGRHNGVWRLTESGVVADIMGLVADMTVGQPVALYSLYRPIFFSLSYISLYLSQFALYFEQIYQPNY